ncbi:hypothetical protein B0H13DRAFT_1935519 [Mycena leptocephala]|nr:hypothetical protein B0H13DRAFT_1935519 [Mycena leptocephala]
MAILMPADSDAPISGSRMNCCSPARNVDQSILQLNVDELELAAVQSEDWRVLRGRCIVRVPYLPSHVPVFPSRSLRPFVSGFDNNPVLSSTELPAWQIDHSMFALLLIYAFHPISLPVHISPTLIADMLIPGKPMRARPGYISAAFCGSSPQAAFLSTRSLARPRTRLPPVPLSLLLSSLHRAGSAKHERSTKTNGLIFRTSVFVPHDGDNDQWRRPQLKHKPVFCHHASSRMQRRSRPFPALQDHMRSSRHRYVIRRVVPLRRPDASRNCAVWSRSVVVVGTRDAHERAAIVISSVRSLAGTGIEKRMYWFGDACHWAFAIAGDALSQVRLSGPVDTRFAGADAT